MEKVTVEIDMDIIKKVYNGSNSQHKELLEGIFGEDIFKPKSIMDRVKTFEDAVKIRPLTKDEKLLLSIETEDKNVIAAQSFLKLSIVTEVLNEGWVPDYSNSNQYKYYPFWNMMGSGSGFSFAGSDCYYTDSDVGARLSFKSEELSDYAAKQFFSLYKDMLTF